MDAQRKFDLIITVVNRGFTDDVMHAAKSAGATGGTIMHARGTGIHEAERFFGVSIQPEKELVLILIEREKKQDVMRRSVDKSAEYGYTKLQFDMYGYEWEE